MPRSWRCLSVVLLLIVALTLLRFAYYNASTVIVKNKHRKFSVVCNVLV